MQSPKKIMTIWVKWKKPVKSIIILDTWDIDSSQDVGDNPSGKYIKVEISFDTALWIIFFFLIQVLHSCLYFPIARQKWNSLDSQMPEIKFMLNQAM